MRKVDIDTITDDSPLNDPAYEPEHQPVNGTVPAVVERWGAKSQVRWFARYGQQIKAMPHAEWERWNVDSTMHKGPCCESCYQDDLEGYGLEDPDVCCCVGLRARDA